MQRSTIQLAAALVAAIDLSTAFAAPPTAESDAAVVVVTATRQPTRIAETLSDTEVISRDEIERSGQGTLADLLRSRAGLELVANGGPGQAASVFIRGANAGHTLLLMDGQRLNSATLGTAAIEHLPAAMIEHVEILRGAASSLYGADAIGGVIQIFTRRNDSTPQADGGIGFGSLGTVKGDAHYGGRSGNLGFDMHASGERTNGFSALHDPDPNFAAVGFTDPFNADRDGYRNQSFGGRLSYRFAPGQDIEGQFSRISGFVHFDAPQGGWPNPTTAAFDARIRQRIDTSALVLRNRLAENWDSTLRIGTTVDDQLNYRLNTASNAEFQSRFRTDQNQASWQNDFRAGPGKLMLAAEYLNQRVSSTSVFTATERTIRSLLAGYHAWYGDHGIQASVRRDDNDQFGVRNTGGLTYGYRMTPAWRTDVGVKTAFKAPTFNDLYFPVDPVSGGGNAALRPEQSRSGEVGLHYESARRRADLIYYRTRVENLIEWRPIAGNPLFWTPQNVSAALLRGVTANYETGWADWTLRATLDIQSPTDLGRDVTLNNRARRHGAIAVTREAGAWRYGAEVAAVSRRYEDSPFTFAVPADVRLELGGYTTVNGTIEYQVDRNLSLLARANNIFDKRYEQRYGFASAPATVFIGVRYAPPR